MVVQGRKWSTVFTGRKGVKCQTDSSPGKERVKLNMVVQRRKWSTFFTGRKGVKCQTDSSPGKERVREHTDPL